MMPHVTGMTNISINFCRIDVLYKSRRAYGIWNELKIAIVSDETGDSGNIFCQTPSGIDHRLGLSILAIGIRKMEFGILCNVTDIFEIILVNEELQNDR